LETYLDPATFDADEGGGRRGHSAEYKEGSSIRFGR